jgi:hypothetical protein
MSVAAAGLRPKWDPQPFSDPDLQTPRGPLLCFPGISSPA